MYIDAVLYVKMLRNTKINDFNYTLYIHLEIMISLLIIIVINYYFYN